MAFGVLFAALVFPLAARAQTDVVAEIEALEAQAMADFASGDFLSARIGLREAMKGVLPEVLYKREKFAFMAPPSHTDTRKQAALRALATWKSARWTVTLDGETREFDGYCVAVSN